MSDSNIQSVDYLIVGQGLAGSLLAWSLLQQGKQVQIIDNHHLHASSAVAAGLINPLAGKRLAKAENTDRCLQTALKQYQELSTFFKQPFFHAVEMIRLFKDPEQGEILAKRSKDPAYSSFLGNAFSSDVNIAPLQNSHGGVLQKQTGYLDMPGLLSALRLFFLEKDCLHETLVDADSLTISNNSVSWNNITARKCIFCEGYQAASNPWFDWLPFQLAKGEILTIESRQLLTSKIINKGNWLIPLQTNRYKTGASNEWLFEDNKPTDQGQRKIKQQFHQLLQTVPEYSVIQHQAGIRPATRDRQPFIGSHPAHPSIAIFNGFGARGGMTIPYYAELFTEVLCGQKNLPEHVDIQRFYPL